MRIHFIDVFFLCRGARTLYNIVCLHSSKNLNRLLRLNVYYSIKNIVIILIALCRYNIAQRDNVYYYYVYIPAYYRGAAIPQGAVSRHPIHTYNAANVLYTSRLRYRSLFTLFYFFLFCFCLRDRFLLPHQRQYTNHESKT